MCMYLEDPVEVLLRKPPPAVDAPFLKRVQFLFEGEDSVQNYAKRDTFDDRYVVDEILRFLPEKGFYQRENATIDVKAQRVFFRFRTSE